MPANAKSGASSIGASGASALDQVTADAKKYQPIGRVSMEIDQNLTQFKTSVYNITLQDQDTITIPQNIDTVTVFGEVYKPSSFIYNAKASADDYIKMASGLSSGAASDKTYVIHADGTSEPINNGWFSRSVKIAKGDTIVVPLYIKEYNNLEIWDSVSKILSNFAITAASLKTIGAIQ